MTGSASIRKLARMTASVHRIEPPLDLLIRPAQLLAPATSWKIGGPAAFFAEPAVPRELELCLRWAADRGLPVLALGGGSNILVADEGYPGLVVRYRDRGLELQRHGDTARLRLGARIGLARSARWAARSGWAGLEWAEGIPGTIGGAIVGNAGAFGGEVAGVVESVETFSLEEGSRWLRRGDCDFGYRRSRFKNQDPTRTFLLGASWSLIQEDPERLLARIRSISAERRTRTPAGLSCGSVFKNPPGHAAGRLIEDAGLKGEERGGAQISPAHGNYIVNRGGATARDVLALIDLARARVRREFGIELELEVQLVGFPDPTT